MTISKTEKTEIILMEITLMEILLMEILLMEILLVEILLVEIILMEILMMKIILMAAVASFHCSIQRPLCHPLSGPTPPHPAATCCREINCFLGEQTHPRWTLKPTYSA